MFHSSWSVSFPVLTYNYDGIILVGHTLYKFILFHLQILHQDDTDEEDESSSHRRKKKKPRYGGFILDEAEVDDDVEDDEDWEEGAEDIIDKTQASEENTSKDIESNRRLQMMWT